MSVRPSVAVGLTTVALVALLRYEESPPAAAPVSRPVAVAPPVTTAPVAPPSPATPARPAATAAAPPPAASRAPAPPPATTPVRPAASRATAAAPARAPSTTVAAPPPTHAAPPPSPAPQSATYTGQTTQTPYGPVQVKIWVTGSRITDVQALQLPNDTPRSQQISSYAGPQLRQEALQAQSANIDTVSGATYTSDGYRQSLQSALDQAHLG